jgi:hypothetical protein
MKRFDAFCGKRMTPRFAKAMAMLGMVILTSCEITPSIDDQSGMSPATELDTKRNSSIRALDELHLMWVSLHFTSSSDASALLRVDITDELGTRVIGSSFRQYPIGEPATLGWTIFPFSNVALTKGVKYRISVTRLGDQQGVINWTGLSNAGERDWYIQGGSSAGAGDFNFQTFEITGLRDQLCFGGDVGTELKAGESVWQQFVPGNNNVMLSKLKLRLSNNSDSPYSVFVDIRDTYGNIVATSLPTIVSFGTDWVNFQFPNSVVLDKTRKYRICPRTVVPSPYPWQGVSWTYTTFNRYHYGISSAHATIDYTFGTDVNGFPDQQQTEGYGRNFYTLLPANQNGLTWQEFTPAML